MLSIWNTWDSMLQMLWVLLSLFLKLLTNHGNIIIHKATFVYLNEVLGPSNVLYILIKDMLPFQRCRQNLQSGMNISVKTIMLPV